MVWGISEMRLEMDNESVELGRPDRPPQERPGGPDRPSGSSDADFIRPTRPQSGRPNLVRPGRPGLGINRPARPHGRPGRPQGRPHRRPGRPGRPLNFVLLGWWAGQAAAAFQPRQSSTYSISNFQKKSPNQYI